MSSNRETRRRFVLLGAAAGGGLLAGRAAPASAHPEATSLRLEPTGDRGSAYLGIDGEVGPASFAGTTSPEPYTAFRLTRPDDPRTGDPGHPGGPVDFYVVPYNAGMAIEFKGIVECWVEDWSIHNNNRGGGTIGEEARFWVGNNLDTGGAFLTAHTKPGDGPRDRFVRLVSRNYEGNQGNGPMQFVVRDPADHFSFGFGDTGGPHRGIGDPTETVRIRSDGWIGSGTDDPQARLHLVEPAGPAELRIENAGPGAGGSVESGRAAARPPSTPATQPATSAGHTFAWRATREPFESPARPRSTGTFR